MRVLTQIILTRAALAAALVGLSASAALATPQFSDRSLNEASTGQATPAGVAAVRCVLGEQGALTNCQVLSESPAGIGLGEQALRMAGTFKMPAGEPGRVITIPMRFMLAPGQQVPGTANP